MKEWTLPAIIANQNSTFGTRNNLRFDSLNQRIYFLLVGASDFKKLVRKNADTTALGIALARVVSRIICVAHHFGNDFPLAEAFAEKWLNPTCRYCQQSPCTCATHARPDAVLESNSEALDWSLSRIAQHLQGLYGEPNRRLPIDTVYSRLIEEISEVITVLVGLVHSPESNMHLLKEVALELSDALAWTISLANYLEIDLEQAYVERYGNGCLKCKSIPCQCGAFEWPQAAAWAATLSLE